MSISYYKASLKEFSYLLDFFHICYPELKIDTELLQWKYLNNPFGEAQVYFAFDSEMKVRCGCYCLFPKNITCNSKDITIAIAGDLMVLPTHRRRGIFQKIMQFVYADLNKLPYAFLIGFPNKISLLGHVKFGWQPIRTFTIYKKIINPIYLLNLIKITTPERLDKFCFKLLSATNRQFKDKQDKYKLIRTEIYDSNLSELISISTTHQIQHSEEYIKWRYFEKPYANYKKYIISSSGKAQGYIIINIIGKRATVLDIYPLHDMNMICFALQALTSHLLDENVFLIEIPYIGSNTGIFNRCGYIKREETIPMILYSSTHSRDIQDHIKADWTMFLGDCDAITF